MAYFIDIKVLHQRTFLLTWINFNPGWISNHYNAWDEITYPFSNVNGATTLYRAFAYLIHAGPRPHFGFHHYDMFWTHYNDVIMGATASQIIGLTIVFSTVYLETDRRKHQSSASLAFVRGIHRGPVNSSHTWMASNAENVSIWWRHHEKVLNDFCGTLLCSLRLWWSMTSWCKLHTKQWEIFNTE